MYIYFKIFAFFVTCVYDVFSIFFYEQVLFHVAVSMVYKWGFCDKTKDELQKHGLWWEIERESRIEKYGGQ